MDYTGTAAHVRADISKPAQKICSRRTLLPFFYRPSYSSLGSTQNGSV